MAADPPDSHVAARRLVGAQATEAHTRGGPTPGTPGMPQSSADMATLQFLAERAAASLLRGDAASALLGIRLLEVRPGFARVAMTIRSDMVNGHNLCHGGFIFTLADTAFAVSCNSHNENAVAAAASIDFLAPGSVGDELTAEASELWRAGRSGIYEITVTNQRGERIALFRGRSHRISGQVTTA